MEPAAIETRNLRFSYPDGTSALRGIDLSVAKGERVGIIGPNGAGKSTFLLHLNGILLGKGEVRIAGLPVRPESLREIRRRVGIVFQNPDDQLFMPTVFEDLAFGPLNLGLSPPEAAERVEAALAEVGLPGFGARSPHHLSYGERKRVALAAVLAMQPPILVLDEPTGGLDPRGRREFLHLLAGLPGTVLVAAHDLEMIAGFCRRVVLFSGGEKVADGESTEILRDQPRLAAAGL